MKHEMAIDETKDVMRSFIIGKKGRSFIPVKTEDVYVFIHDSGSSYAVDKSGNKYIVDKTLTELEQMLEKKMFFRVNRQLIINVHSIKEFQPIEFGKLQVQLKNSFWIGQDIIVSQLNAPFFKKWILNL